MNFKPHESTYKFEDSDGTITADNIALAKQRATLARNYNRISFDYMASIIKIEVLARAKSKPVFLTGDWNALPNSRFVTYIKSFMTNLTPEDTPTFHGVIKKLPFRGDGKCIDYIAIDTAHKDQYNIISSKVIEERMVSDHAPIVVEISK
jgi:exonuclease III